MTPSEHHYADPESDNGEGWTQQKARSTPVEPTTCIWCKTPREDADCEYHDISTHEAICDTCIRDLREWKRYLYVQFYVSTGLTPAVERILHDHGSAVTAELAQHYENDSEVDRISKQFSNARERDTTYDPPQD